MVEDINSDGKEPIVNLSNEVIKDIKDAWILGSKFFRSGNAVKWFVCLKCIYINTDFILTQEQVQELCRLEQKTNKCLDRLKPTGLQYPEKNEVINNQITKEAMKYIEQYNHLLKKSLYDAKFLFLTKSCQDKKSDM